MTSLPQSPVFLFLPILITISFSLCSYTCLLLFFLYCCLSLFGYIYLLLSFLGCCIPVHPWYLVYSTDEYIMPFKTVALSAALTPTVISTWFSHYFHRKSLHNTPSVHISYDEGIHVMREFLVFASKYPVEDLQEFSRQWVPSPHWVRTEPASISDKYLESAAKTLIAQLGPKGIKDIGGEEWWQWRGPAEDLRGEWIEMRNDYNERKKVGEEKPKGRNRIILYVHGGAYFFGSVDTHRYQMQRHARKLKGRVFAPQYRLSPQYPFPCSLQDCLASYLWLLSIYEPKEIIFAGDSAGGGMALSLLVTIRDQGLPLPAGGILISPWVDLTHSFPSIIANNPFDYIPPYGFRHKPSQAWPPPNSDEILTMKKEVRKDTDAKTGAEQAMPKQDSQAQDTAKKGYTSRDSTDGQKHAYPGQQKDKEGAEKEAAGSVSINVDGKTIEIKDQIHMYTTNRLLSHPLVSPALQTSLGGLPPLLVLTGGGEMLRDEQIYLAHKAAHPTAYPPGDVYLDEYDPNGEILSKYPPTCVQLQVWDNLCHVAPTLSFSRPAKYMFRSISQFGAWAFAHAQNTEIDILVDNDPAISSPDDHSSSSSASSISGDTEKNVPRHAVGSIGKAGDPLPDFENHMIRQRVDKRGHVYPLDPPSSFEALQMPASQVGAFNPVLVKRWLAAKQEWDDKFAKEKLRVQKQRMTELYHQFQNFKDETPPPSSLAARREAPGVLPPRRERKSYLMMMWSSWASKHDKRLVGKAGKEGGSDTKSVVDTGQIRASRASSSSDEGAKPVPPEKSTKAASDAQPTANTGPKGIAIDAGTANKTLAEERKRPTNELNRGDSTSNQPGSPMTYKSSLDRPLGSPLLVLPDYDNKKNTPKEENASTRALFHAPGTLPASASDTSLSRISKSHRPTSSYTGSIAPTEDANSIIADEKSLAVTNNTGGGAAFDNASTRALLNSTGVVGAIPLASGTNSARQSIDARRSIDALSRTASDIDAVSFAGGADEAANGRPKMPERDVFRTADEF